MVEEGAGDDEFDDDCASTAARKASPRTRTTARERGWRRPTMAAVIDEEVSLAKAEEWSAGERNGDKGLNESDGRGRFNGKASVEKRLFFFNGYLLWYTRSLVNERGDPGRNDAGMEGGRTVPLDRPGGRCRSLSPT